MNFVPLLVATGAYLFFKGNRVVGAARSLSIDVVGGKFYTPTEIRLRVRLTNTTGQSLAFRGLVLNAWYKGSKLGTAVFNEPTDVRPAGFTTLTVPLFISLTGALSALWSVVSAGGKLTGVLIEGNVQTGLADVPVNQSIDLAGLGK